MNSWSPRLLTSGRGGLVGGVRVRFAPFQAEPVVRKSGEPLEGVTTSSEGFLADQDSGGMIYVIRLA